MPSKGRVARLFVPFTRNATSLFCNSLNRGLTSIKSYLKSFIASLIDLEPSPAGFTRQEFLVHELEQGLKNTLQITAEPTQEANEIMKSVSDIVALPLLEDGRFIQASRRALDSSRETVEKLENFDRPS
ncbi:T7SS effector LXG polymorphic toxin [Cytobacillus sp.]|uniref:T7SS effector LXG polymorphic toxin n=1 Tax=Cytobacillus sp. TaxID=2675269 RepID=UPI003510EB5F